MSAIEWTDVTWNPIRGCSRVSEGCRNCYAERMAARFSGPGEPFFDFAKTTPRGGRWTGTVELLPAKLNEPLRWKKPRRVFVNSMSDLFHEKLSSAALAAVFGVMACSSQHTFQVLTKRPDRMRQWTTGMTEHHRVQMGVGLSRAQVDYPHALQVPFGWPLPNVWLGVSVEDQETADERIPLLLQTPAAMRFVSYEPALGPVDLRAYLAKPVFCDPYHGQRLDWVIVGGESGPGARPFDLAWARSVVAQCREASVPCFVKQLGARWADDRRLVWTTSRGKPVQRYVSLPRGPKAKGGDPSEWPEDLKVREFPR